MSIRIEVVPFVVASVVLGVLIALGVKAFGAGTRMASIAGLVVALVFSLYMLFFFRDPDRTIPEGESLIVAGADGVIARIVEMRENGFLKEDTVRISIFLSLFNVHVNRAVISGKSTFLGYFPGKRLFTFQEKSSDVNQHNAILIEGQGTRCLMKQIVGPVCRRVVYWPDHDKPVEVRKGDKIGMMKFGSRMDLYFPKSDVLLKVKEGDKVTAGETVIAVVDRRQKE
ncbi:MAG: phosphatidylserine decarboxylase family protein [Lentisphaerae bacterium]|nr:phosphatidylserine decarboxylase family protein [Lentisphaerota bacterium]